jgi:methionyl aminopeptidase
MMQVTSLKSAREIELMRQAGQVVAEVLQLLAENTVPGVTTAELDNLAEVRTRARGGRCAFKGYHGFPANVCISLNEEVVHGIPGPRKIAHGDVVSLDFGVKLHNYVADAARTVLVGSVSDEAKRLVQVTEESLQRAIQQMVPGNRLSDVSRAVQDYVESNGFSVVRQFVGHGIGRRMHEDPKVPNYVEERGQGSDLTLREGLVLAIEPMVNCGTYEVRTLKNGWTVVTKDGRLSAHAEHTVAVTADGPQVLTML